MKPILTVLAFLSIQLFFCSVGSAQTTAEEWQAKAVADYPELGVPNSELNRKFVQKVTALRETNADFFKDPCWPYILAEELNKKPVIPGLDQVPPVRQSKPPPTPKPRAAYISGNNQVEIVDANDLVAKGVQGQNICLEGVVTKTFEHGQTSNDSFYVEIAPNIMCEFLVKPFILRSQPALNKAGI